MVNSGYHSFLIRMWCTHSHRDIAWHIVLENPLTEKRHSFSSLADAMVFLQKQIDSLEEATFTTPDSHNLDQP